MFEIPLIIDTFSVHSIIKNKMLFLIEETKSKHLDSLEQQITKTDWNKEERHKYKDDITPFINQYANKWFLLMNYSSFQTGAVWFQQYQTQDFHSWHRHPDTDWGFIYYLELPTDGPSTEFRNPLNNKQTILPDVKEGQFILFPAFLEHRSSENQSNKRKTVIVTNFKTV